MNKLFDYIKTAAIEYGYNEEMEKDAAAGITQGMLVGNVARNTFGKIIPGLFRAAMGTSAVAGKGMSTALEGVRSMTSAGTLSMRELAATRGASNPQMMKNIIRNSKSAPAVNKLFGGIAKKYPSPLTNAMAEGAKMQGPMADKMYYSIKRGINPFSQYLS